MKKEKNNFFKGSIYTDLALELHEMATDDENKNDDENCEIEGVKLVVKESPKEDIKVTWVEVLNEQGAEEIGKPIGNYITVESEAMRENDVETHEEIIKVVAENLSKLCKLDKDSSILIIGLGNWNVTPDALGPKVISKALVTRHISESLPNDLSGMVRRVSAVSPGVMGITGIETSEIVKGIVERIKPDLVIAIDALASRSINRINATIQMADTGVAPGGGMGNKRMVINEETMGVPVIAIGVPTVVDAATLINDTMDSMLEDMISYTDKGTDFYEMLKNLGADNRYPIIKDVLNPYAGNMFVTPKEVDAVVERLSNIIANSINISMHPGITKEDINRYMY